MCKSEYIADGTAALVRLLAKHGANLKTCDIWGQTPLQLCVFNRNWRAATAPATTNLCYEHRSVLGLYPVDYEFDAPDCVATVGAIPRHARFAVLLLVPGVEVIYTGDAFDDEAGRAGFAEWNFLTRDANAGGGGGVPPFLANFWRRAAGG